ncbi:MAG: DNRLRE domain-containing protein, partial [Caldilineae bacterium]
TVTPTPTITPTATPDTFTITLKPGLDGYTGVADTYISNFDPQVNYAGSPLLSLSEVFGSRHRGLLLFDLQRIPQGATVRAARLRLVAVYRSESNTGRSLLLHRMVRRWDVNRANWYLATSSSAWVQAGAGAPIWDFVQTPTDVAAVDEGDTYTFDVTADVQEWLNGTNNLGWQIRISEGSTLLLQLASAEYADPALRPELELTLETGTELATPTPTPSPPATPTPGGAAGNTTVNYALQPGWNSLSLPIIPFDPSLPAVLSSIEGAYEQVLWYDNSAVPPRWRHYAPGDPSSDLSGVPQLIGVWIKMKETALLSVSGIIPQTTVIPLRPGWNHVGFPALAPQPVEAALAAIAGSYDRVFVWDNGADEWLRYEPNAADNTLTEFRPGDAIWIHATAAVNLSIVN